MSYHPAETAAAPETPTRLGRYELIGQLATGGMAEIHLARLAGEAGFEKTVVVKRLLPELVASKAYVAMFLDEGKLVARLDHPNVCEVHELGRDGAEYFLVMPYLDGVPVHDFIARPRDPDRIAQLRVAAGIVAQACAGLHHAHELKGEDGALLGLVHRDVSPSNLFVTTAGVVKVLDFGIAKVHGGAETEAGTIKGKTQYMAPEQLLGDQLDRRCDVFALGIVLFELATHSRLFKRSSDYLAARAILEEPIPRADAVDPAVPAALADVIAKALDRAKDKRYADARELAKAVETAMQPHGGVATADQIAAALADWHGAELSAMRTRQAKVIADARSRATAVTVPGKAAADPSRMLTTPRDVVRKRRLGVIALAVLVVGGTGAVLAISMVREGQRNSQLAKAPDRVVAETPLPADGDVALAADAAVAVVAPDAAPTGAPAITDFDKLAEKTKADKRPKPKQDKARGDKQTANPRGDKQSAKVDDTPGRFSVESFPFAKIYIDGTYVDQTPIIGTRLSPGKHTVKAVREDGKIKTFDVTIEPGKLFNKGTLSWN
ncbi:MAG TPA: serine/threonine-protein kinase [Kofleriaceae bacterium]|nr:serine/threonine-protein kinase [Kofleriaceae bacterium]